MKIKATSLFFTFLFLSATFLAAQKRTFTISGYIEDAETGEKLIAANVFDKKTAQGAVSNTYGFYSLTLSKDSVFLNISYIGYQTQDVRLKLDKDLALTFKLQPTLTLKEVEITADRAEKIEEQTQMSKITVPVELIKKVPTLMGEVDVLKTLQLLPGVQSGGEGQTGLYVRGGSPDQNLILLDGVPVYNVSHLLGFFSVFNADAIKNVTLIKGGFPSRYGGRLSSIIDITMKEGNNKKIKGEGSIGLISSKLTLEGPIWKNKTSFLLSARRTYLDLLFKPLLQKANSSAGSTDKIDLQLYFYDLNAKINHKINDQHRLYLSAYSGLDILGTGITSSQRAGDYDKIKSGTDWGNLTSAFRWNYQISPRLFANTTLTYSRYGFNIGASQESKTDAKIETFSFAYRSGIQDWAGKIDVDYIPNPNHYVRAGLSTINHTYTPGAVQFKAKLDQFQIDTLLGSKKTTAKEYDYYVEDDARFGALKVNYGLHGALFNVEGKSYPSFQPRLGLNYLLNNSVAVKAAFSTMTQYINLLTNESLSLPTDLWVPSTKRILPQSSWQIAAGLAKTFSDKYEVSIEGYYKDMKNVLSYKPGASFLGFENDWQDKVTQGRGKAYGAEFFIQKKKGKTTGWIGYTLAWNYRQFDEVAGSKWYPFKYDRRHDASFVLVQEITDRFSFSAAWVYGTGNAITLPTDNYIRPVTPTFATAQSTFFTEFSNLGEKNANRMNAYHRLDVSFDFTKKRRYYNRKWSFGAYNAYSRRNPYYVYQTRELNKQNNQYERVFKQVSLFPIVPYFSYGFTF